MDITIQIDDKEQAILGFMMKDFMQSDELECLRRENEKLSAYFVTLDKIIGVVYDEDLNLSQAMIKISEIVDKKDD